METAALVAPVTALEFLQDAFLLTGEGPVLTVYSLHPRPKACVSLSVLQHYRIHGIRPRNVMTVQAQSSATRTYGEKKDELSSTSGPNFFDLAVFGGKTVRLVRLHVDLQYGEQLHLEILGPLMELQDWALDVRWLSGDKHSLLCVAVSHNGALLLDIMTGNALVQRFCLEGCLLYSALLLVHESWEDTILVGGTVFNQLVLWKPGGGGDKRSYSEHKAPVETRLLGHSGVIFSISYLQEKGMLASASDDRSVRVWAIGALGGPGGKCGDLNPACLRVLYGHQARVFSVRLSAGNVFSAGEDGACLVWDWAGGGKVVRTLKGHRAGGVRALAVSEETGDGERWVATGGADGGVRLWRVEGSKEGKETMEEAATEKLTDLKFPAQGLPKVVCIAGEEDKNTSWSQSKFVVCTDQGRVYQYGDGQWETVWQGTPDFQSYCVMETITVSVKDSTAKVNLCAVGNISGSLQVFPISHPQCGILLTGGLGKIHSLIWQEAKEGLYLLASGAEGRVYRWCIAVELDEKSSLALNVNPLPHFLLPPCAKRWLTAAVRLHSTSQGLLWVCGDRRGSLLLFQEGGKLEQKMRDDKRVDESLLTGRKQTDDEGVEDGGDRKSEMMEERERKEVGDLKLHPLNCLFGVHGKQGVTSVYEYQGLLYSTGRDGCVRVFRVIQTPLEKREEKSVENKEGLRLEVLRVQRACKGMEWLERILILEPDIPVEEDEEELGEKCGNHYKTNMTEKLVVTKEGSFRVEVEKTENKGREARFAIIGFHAVHFVVWDPVTQERLLVVPCGGGHRSWSLWPSHKGVWPGYGALVFIKQGAVLVSQSPREAQSWGGKAGRTGGWGLREGVHGKGIGCVCRLGTIRGIGNEIQTNSTGDLTETEGKDKLKDEVKEVEGGHWEIVVMGGEDTSLTVVAVHPNSGSIKVLSVITDHISSVRTVTAVTRPEGGSENQAQSLSALLVSAGGRAQMQCYRLLIGWDEQRRVPSCQVIQVASHRLDEQWEKRRNRHKTVKMDPETRYMSVVAVDEKTDGCLLALACSDGALRLFSVSEVKHQIDLLWEMFYHQRCVLSVAACSLEDGKGNRYKLLFSAATDGKIAVWDLTDASSLLTGTQPIPCLDIHTHQSGVNSLAVWVENLGHQEGSCLVTVASGGDDGQLTVSKIRVQYPEDGKIGASRGFSQVSEPLISLQTQFQPPNQLDLHLHSQSHILLAHAAPLTALKLLSPGLVVSTSSDQRVCLWRVGSTGISHIGTLCSHIADAAGLAVWEGQMKEEEERDKKRKTTFESEQEIVIWRGKASQTGSKRTCKTAAQFNKDEETADEAEDGEPVEAVNETGDPVCQTSDEKGGETAGECRNQAETDRVSETRSEVNTERGFQASCESKKKREKTGWVLVCGQGFQLLRVPNTEMWTARSEMEKVPGLVMSRERLSLQPGHQANHRKRSQQQTSSSSSHPHPGPSSILVSDTTMTPWGGLALSESSFTSIPPPPPPRPPPLLPPPPLPPAPQPTPSTLYRGRQNEDKEVSSSSFNSEAPSPPGAVPQDSVAAAGAVRGLRARRRLLPQSRVPRPPRLPPLRPVTNLSFSRSFTFSFFELPLHQSPRCRAERIRNLMLLLRQIHY
ncbi:LOW QUALITY PROTEIN: WD repeat-containing protein 6-like [Cottoperca gobio]|uniref:tRNA (34-2'-O)-methyltransferase regulator WDR6 n=1 Tax=Cottoperca gobio TaxID=56716 RepID=A0A6J2PZW5_COTGO|nr:LOW QUALITY PROTEIN: WD repeat-containing protein 6 [Cottoperca gobio]